jgi:hypothetical protein
VLQTFNSQFHKPWYQQGKTVGCKKKTPAGCIAPAKRNKILLQECKLFNGDYPSRRCEGEPEQFSTILFDKQVRSAHNGIKSIA